MSDEKKPVRFEVEHYVDFGSHVMIDQIVDGKRLFLCRMGVSNETAEALRARLTGPTAEEAVAEERARAEPILNAYRQTASHSLAIRASVVERLNSAEKRDDIEAFSILSSVLALIDGRGSK